MKIAVLAWGSLIWDPRTLACNGAFETGGPVLPIEFSRVSRNGRLTLVIDPVHGTLCSTQFAQSTHSKLAQAVENLRSREGTTLNGIGWVKTSGQEISSSAFERHPGAAQEIMSWATKHKWDAVIWTALGSNFERRTGLSSFSTENAITYLGSLPAETKRLAIEYILSAPSEIDNPFRRKFTSIFRTTT